ncbi:MAG: hypothetical protein ACIAQF_04245 [Phycisphaerales bacterium JB065]
MIWFSLMLSIAAVIIGVMALRKSRAHAGSILATSISVLCLIPLGTLIMMRSAGASPVRQLNGGDTDWWSLWFDLWPTFYFGLMACGLCAIFGLVSASVDALHWREQKYHRLIVGQWIVVIGQLAAVFWLIGTNFPDA